MNALSENLDWQKLMGLMLVVCQNCTEVATRERNSFKEKPNISEVFLSNSPLKNDHTLNKWSPWRNTCPYITRARILLKSDLCEGGPNWSCDATCDAFDVNPVTVA
jgi:hypothetical protein